MVKLQMKHGMTGVGIYWCLIEIAYENNGTIPSDDCERIAFELRTEYERINSVLNDFELFYQIDGFYRSESIDRRLQEREEKSASARRSINARWGKPKDQAVDTNVIRTNDKRNTIKVNKSKEKKSKEEDIKTWRSDFSIYLSECKTAYRSFVSNEKLMAEQARLNPGINVPLSIEKGFVNFWGTEAGWKNKKAAKSVEIDWKRTIVNSIEKNKTYFTREQQVELTKKLKLDI